MSFGGGEKGTKVGQRVRGKRRGGWGRQSLEPSVLKIDGDFGGWVLWPEGTGCPVLVCPSLPCPEGEGKEGNSWGGRAARRLQAANTALEAGFAVDPQPLPLPQ